MKFDKNLGLWTEDPERAEKMQNIADEILGIIRDDVKQKWNISEDPEDEDEQNPEPHIPSYAPETIGRCILSIQIKNHAQHLKWKKYNPAHQWDFLVDYPAIMRAEYVFKNALEVEMMAKKIVSLLQMGFDVYSASWQLDSNQKEEKEK